MYCCNSKKHYALNSYPLGEKFCYTSTFYSAPYSGKISQFSANHLCVDGYDRLCSGRENLYIGVQRLFLDYMLSWTDAV